MKCLADVDGHIGSMEIGLVLVDSLLFFKIMVFGGKETLEVCPGFFGWLFLAPFFAAVTVLTTGADGMVGSL